MEQVIEILLSKLNVTQEEAEDLAVQVKERKMGRIVCGIGEKSARGPEAQKLGAMNTLPFFASKSPDLLPYRKEEKMND